MNLADAALKLGSDKLIMTSYWNIQTRKQSWFFSPNPKLKSATKRPSKFASWNDWDKASSNQKRTLACLAGFKQDATDVVRKASDLSRLKTAYLKWRKDLYAVYWGNNSSKTWTCNIFVGDAIYLAQQKSVTADNGHYYDPRQIKSGKGPFKERKTIEDVKIGDIVVMHGGSHVEIITRFKDYLIADKGFCSCGAGRGSESQMGTEKCDSGTTFDEDRELEYKRNSYHYF